jgi:hypothetical protein
MMWREKHDVNIWAVTHIYHPSANGIFFNKHGSAVKPEIILDCK